MALTGGEGSGPRSFRSSNWRLCASGHAAALRAGRELRRRARDRQGSSRSRTRASSQSSGSPKQTRAPAARTPPRDDVSGHGTAGSAAMAVGWRGFPGELLVQAATLGGLARVSGLQERGPASAPVRDGGLQRVVSHAGWKSRSMLHGTRCCPRSFQSLSKMSNRHCFHRCANAVQHACYFNVIRSGTRMGWVGRDLLGTMRLCLYINASAEIERSE